MLGVIFVGCNNGNGQPDAGSDATTDIGVDVIVDMQNCVPFGTSPNADGVGGYCSPSGGQCDLAGPGLSSRICTADLPDQPAHAWFCTTPCDGTTSCGVAASCLLTVQGPICVPSSCAFLSDAGVDASTDASTDASGDVVGDVLADVSEN
jgi:hypothetical protein